MKDTKLQTLEKRILSIFGPLQWWMQWAIYSTSSLPQVSRDALTSIQWMLPLHGTTDAAMATVVHWSAPPTTSPTSSWATPAGSLTPRCCAYTRRISFLSQTRRGNQPRSASAAIPALWALWMTCTFSVRRRWWWPRPPTASSTHHCGISCSLSPYSVSEECMYVCMYVCMCFMYVCMCVFIVSYTLITCAVSLIHQVLALVPFTWLL